MGYSVLLQVIQIDSVVYFFFYSISALVWPLDRTNLNILSLKVNHPDFAPLHHVAFLINRVTCQGSIGGLAWVTVID